MSKEYTFDTHIVSDLYKDAFGFRPDHFFWEFWRDCSDDEKQARWDSLLLALDITMAMEAEREKEAIAKFEALIKEAIALGAKDRETAYRWIMDASDCDGDWDYLCYHHGIPYGYFNKGAE